MSTLHEVGNVHANFTIDNLCEFLDELSLLSFKDVPMRPSQSVFTLCLQANNL